MRVKKEVKCNKYMLKYNIFVLWELGYVIYKYFENNIGL